MIQINFAIPPARVTAVGSSNGTADLIQRNASRMRQLQKRTFSGGAIMRVRMLVAGILFSLAVAATPAFAESSKRPDGIRLLDHATQRMKLMDCMEKSVDRFDDRLSPADVVASAVAWHCEAEGNPNYYWIILSQRRASPDPVDFYYRDLALLFVLQVRASRLKK